MAQNRVIDLNEASTNTIQAFARFAFDESVTSNTRVCRVRYGIHQVECAAEGLVVSTVSMFTVGNVAIGYSPEADIIFWSERSER